MSHGGVSVGVMSHKRERYESEWSKLWEEKKRVHVNRNSWTQWDGLDWLGGMVARWDRQNEVGEMGWAQQIWLSWARILGVRTPLAHTCHTQVISLIFWSLWSISIPVPLCSNSGSSW